MELSHRPELRHKVTLSPQVYQGLAILAMPIVELQQLVEVEMLENPVLEVDESESEPLEGEDKPEEREEDERSWDDWLEMYEDLDSMEPTAPRDPNAETANTEDFVGGVQTFDDYLLNQLALLDIPDEAARAGRAVIGSLDADGFFVGSLDEIAALTGVSRHAAVQGLDAVQQLDPPGVGARDLNEALCLQMEFLGLDEPLLTRIIKSHLDDVASNHFRKIARALKVDEDEVRRLVDILRALNPRPAGAFSPGPSPGYIVPDVTLRRFDDECLRARMRNPQHRGPLVPSCP
jgi:RNA polymerase sigma-54 factor